MADRDSESGRFLQGNSGNPKGRPKGNRNKLGEAFLNDLYEDWQKHGESVIQAVRKKKPDAYMKVVASILPKDLNVNVNKYDDMTDEELRQRLRDLHGSIAEFIGDDGSGRDSGGTEAPTTH